MMIFFDENRSRRFEKMIKVHKIPKNCIAPSRIPVVINSPSDCANFNNTRCYLQGTTIEVRSELLIPFPGTACH